MRFHTLSDKVENHYFKNNQQIHLTTQYVDEGKLTEQFVCLIDKKKNECIFCVRVRTFKDLYFGELGHQIYCKYDYDYNEFTITIPTFTYLTKIDLANAIHHIVRENIWCIFNIFIDEWNISEFLTLKNKPYQLSHDELRRY
jgi:hypothetical protein